MKAVFDPTGRLAPGRDGAAVNLALDDDELAACVQCGLCLPHCPTFRVTGEESASPRGRIALMRQVQWDGAPVDDAFVGYMDACVQCRGVRDGVPVGRAVRPAHGGHARRCSRASGRSYQPWWRRAGYRAARHTTGSCSPGRRALGVAQRAAAAVSRGGRAGSGCPNGCRCGGRRCGRAATTCGCSPGCVMDAWQRDVHAAAQRVIEATGAGVALPSSARGAGCCGALPCTPGCSRQRRAHGRRGDGVDAGRRADPRRLRRMRRGDEGLRASARHATRRQRSAHGCYDVHEWLAARLDRLPPPRRSPRTVARSRCRTRATCATCSVRTQHVRTVLAPYVAQLVELDDEGLCCGAGGAYAALHPDLAGDDPRPQGRRHRAVRARPSSRPPTPAAWSTSPMPDSTSAIR